MRHNAERAHLVAISMENNVDCHVKKRYQANLHSTSASFYLDIGSPNKAIEECKRGLDVSKKISADRIFHKTNAIYAQALLEKGDIAGPEEILKKSLSWFSRLGDARNEIDCIEALVELYMKGNNKTAALLHCEEFSRMAKKSKNRDAEMRAESTGIWIQKLL